MLDLPVRWNAYRTDVLVEVLHVPDCPNVDEIRERLASAAAQASIGIEIRSRVVDDETEARRLGMRGSPTVRIPGSLREPAEEAAPGSVSCLLRLPTIEELRAALHAAARTDD
jgi:hypothetical protein